MNDAEQLREGEVGTPMPSEKTCWRARYAVIAALTVLFGALLAVIVLWKARQPSAITITCSPNPCNIHSSAVFQKDPFPYMWYYRTEVRNNLDVPIRVTAFEAYSRMNNNWVAASFTGGVLTHDDFVRWYSDGDPMQNGWLAPGKTAVCDPNWHGSSSPAPTAVKWVFTAEDTHGNTYKAEAVIEGLAVPPRRS